MYAIRMLTQKSRERSNGTYPIALVIQEPSLPSRKYRKKKRITLKNMEGIPEHWIKDASRWRKNAPNYKLNNDRLKKLEEKCDEIMDQMVRDSIQMTTDNFVLIYEASNKVPVPEKIYSVYDEIKLYEKWMTDLNRTGSAEVLRATARVWKSYVETLPGEDHIEIKDLKLSDLNKFTLYMKSTRGNSPGTIGIRMRDLRTVYNNASENTDKIPMGTLYPFNRYDWKHTKGSTSPHEFLSKKDWKKFKTAPLPEEHSKWRDVFVFSVYCFGINFKDLTNLTYERNHKGTYIEFVRQKTSRSVTTPIKVHISPAMQELMDRYKDDSDYIMPVLSNYYSDVEKQREAFKYTLKKFNASLKEIRKDLKLNVTKLTTYTSRHTVATLLHFGQVPMGTISQSLGHSTEKQTATYLKQLAPDKVQDIIKDIL